MVTQRCIVEDEARMLGSAASLSLMEVCSHSMLARLMGFERIGKNLIASCTPTCLISNSLSNASFFKWQVTQLIFNLKQHEIQAP